MPGKHAPESPRSFYASVGRSAAGALAVLGVVVLIAVIAVTSRGDEQPGALGSVSPTPTASTSVEPTRTSRTVTTSPEPEPSLRPRSEVAVQVLNGNGRTGAAGVVSSELEQDGYAVVEAANADLIKRTIIYYDEGFEADAEALRKRHFDYARPVRVQPREPGTGDGSANIVVIIGADHPA